jgi:hypothetical protein
MPDYSEKESEHQRAHVFVADIGASADGITALKQFF